MTEGATQYTFQATLLATISVEAATQAEGERKLRTVLETSDANLGFLDNAPILTVRAVKSLAVRRPIADRGATPAA
jgi:hypothetical protein